MQQVVVTYHHENGAWWAESDDLPGFSALAALFSEARQLVAEAAQRCFRTSGDYRLVERLDDGAILSGSYAHATTTNAIGAASIRPRSDQSVSAPMPLPA